jgi:hypothetical protein
MKPTKKLIQQESNDTKNPVYLQVKFVYFQIADTVTSIRIEACLKMAISIWSCNYEIRVVAAQSKRQEKLFCHPCQYSQ